MLIDVIVPETESARRAAEGGAPSTPREYSPLTVLEDRRGREWTVNSYGTGAWVQGEMPPFEAMEIGRIERLHGLLVVKYASPNHRDLFHRKPFPGCHNCPPVPCRCGEPGCTDFEAHYREWAATETAWRAVAA